MLVKLLKIKGDWNEVLNRARTTVKKDAIEKEPSENFKRRIIIAEHSPIRSLVFCFKLTDLKSWVATHLVRHHVGIEKWVSTQRTDRTGIDRDGLPQGALVDMEIEANAQALINMARKRLCNQASKETREVMQELKNEVSKQDKIVASAMVRECVYRGFCPELNCCGFDKTDEFKKELEKYRNINKEV